MRNRTLGLLLSAARLTKKNSLDQGSVSSQQWKVVPSSAAAGLLHPPGRELWPLRVY